MAARVDLVDPGPEGATLAGGLRAAGFMVNVRPLAEVPATQADAVVLAGDAEGALDAIRRLRDDGASPDTPVVMLGAPPGTGHRGSGPGFGAQAVLLRPIALGALIDTLEQVLAPPHSVVSPSRVSPRRERTVQLDASERDDEPPREVLASMTTAERTPRSTASASTPIPITGADPLREVEDLAAAPPSVVRTPAVLTPTEPPSSERSSAGTVRASAAISEHLRELLRAADRRAFPGKPALEIVLPGGDEPASELVPAELLEHDELELDVAPDDDPIDAFTFVGGPVLPPTPSASESRPASVPPPSPSSAPPSAWAPPSSSGPPSPVPPPPTAEASPAAHKKTNPGTPTSLSRRPPPRPTRPPSERAPGERASERDEGGSTGIQEARVRPPTLPPGRAGSVAPRMPSEWPSEDSVLGRVAPDGGRRGTLAVGGALRLLMRIVELRLDARVSITPAPAPGRQGETVTLVAVGGELAALEGPEATRAVALLRRRDRSLAPALDEVSAQRALDEAVARSAITALERDRALREGREQLLRELASTPRATFALARFEDDELPERGTSPLGVPLAFAIVEAARRAISESDARAILGGPVELRRGPRFEGLAADGVIAPELAALFARHEGESDARVIDHAADEPGMPGLVCALVAARALLASPISAPDPAPRERARAARRLIEEAARLAEEGDYFAILGVAHDASDRDVLHTYRRRLDSLGALPLEELDLRELAGARQAALDALDEAHRILSVPRWRTAYAAALSSPALSSQATAASAAGTHAAHDGAHAPQLAGLPPEH